MATTSNAAWRQSAKAFKMIELVSGKSQHSSHDSSSTSNPYGQYGSQYSPDSIHNPYGRYGSPCSNDSANNPYGRDPFSGNNPPTTMKSVPKPYDNLEMLFAFHVSEKARARRERYIQQFPEHVRETEKRHYTLERAVKEVLAEVAEVALLIKELESLPASGK